MSKLFRRPVGVVGLFVCAAGIVFAQQQRVDELLQMLDRTVEFSGPTISPDGRWITWNQNEPGNGTHSYLLNRSANGAQPVEIEPPNGTAYGHGFAWSKDSSRVAFFSDNHIFVLAVASKKYRKLADLNGYARDLRWSPDGSQLAVLYAEGGGGGGPLEAEPAAVGVIGSAIRNQRITLIDTASGAIKPLTPADLNIYEYDWSPDGKQFVVTAAPGPADNNWWIAKLYRVDASSGEMSVVFAPPTEQQLADPRWSPDGKSIALIAGLMSDEGFTGGDVLIVSPGAGEPRNLTSGMKLSASSVTWRNDGELLISEDVNGGSAIADLSAAGGQIKPLWQGPNLLHADGNYPDLALASDGRTAVAVQSTWQDPPEVWAGSMGSFQQITHANANQHPQWGKAESIHWQSGDFRVQGWLLYPQQFDPQRRYPMVVEVHGGPASERAAAWPSSAYDMSVLAGMGYFVFFPNPRGSYGQGEAFTRANVKDFGYGDLHDIEAGVDAVLAQSRIDPDRVGITGWSYGGYMTMWTVTQTHRFRAAVAGAGIADWQSYYGENSIDEWMIPYFGASVYKDPSVYAKSSPIDYINSVKTPTLVLVGERDGECPAPQSFEFWHALKTLGVPTQLVVYAGEGHSFHDQNDRIDRMRRTLDWFNEYLSANGK